MKYSVSVEKRMYVTGTVKIEHGSEQEAVELVQSQIDKGTLQTTDVEWDEPQYEDFSFFTTGDVD